MIKREELTNPQSCMSRARDDEMTFVLLERDVAAPWGIRAWVERRLALGKNKWDDPQIIEAKACADLMEERTLAGAAALPSRPKIGSQEWLQTPTVTKAGCRCNCPMCMGPKAQHCCGPNCDRLPAASVPAASSPTKESQEWVREASEEIRQCCLQQAGYLNAGLTAQIIAKHYAASSPEPNQGEGGKRA